MSDNGQYLTLSEPMAESQSVVELGDKDIGQGDIPQSPAEQASKSTVKGSIAMQDSGEKFSSSARQSKDQKHQNTAKKKAAKKAAKKGKKDMATLDKSAKNQIVNQNSQPKLKADLQGQDSTTAIVKDTAFGSQKTIETIGSSSVDPLMDVDQSAHGKAVASFSPASPCFKMEMKDNTYNDSAAPAVACLERTALVGSETEGIGSSVDQQVEPMEVEDSTHEVEAVPLSLTSPEFKRDLKDHTKDGAETSAGPKRTVALETERIGSSVDQEEDLMEVDQIAHEAKDEKYPCPPPKRTVTEQTQVTSKGRLKIHFHAILSMEFNLDLKEDRIFIWAGQETGTWESCAVELSAKKELGDHGVLVEGILNTDQSNVSIPYKYLVYNEKRAKYAYEYIDSTPPTRMLCLSGKSRVLIEEGDWHQYDIICASPSKNIPRREIAGKIMLQTIFELLHSWNDYQLNSFMKQLVQFNQTYGKTLLNEGKNKKKTKQMNGPTNEHIQKLLKHFMLESVVPQLLKEGNDKSAVIQDPVKAAVIMMLVCKQHSIQLDQAEVAGLCKALCLPNLPRDEFLQYWMEFTQPIESLRNLPDLLVSLMGIAKEERILVIPMLDLLNGSSKPFEPVPFTVKARNTSWAGLRIKENNTELNSRVMLDLIKANGYLAEMDRLVARSWMWLLAVENLVEYSSNIRVELLDMLHVFTIKAPVPISSKNDRNFTATLSHIQNHLKEQKYSCFNDGYGSECLEKTVELLEKICKGIKSSKFTDIAVNCMSLLVSVSNFFQSKITMDMGGDAIHSEDVCLLSPAIEVVRSWLSTTFKDKLRDTSEIRMSSLDQIEIYCSKMEELDNCSPRVTCTIEKCAIAAVPSLCQSKLEGKLFTFKINRKFGKLISAIIQKTWPRDNHGKKAKDEVVLQHLLTWTIAKNIFELYGADKELIEQLSGDTKVIISEAISSFKAICNQLISGSIPIKLLNDILGHRDLFIELMTLDCLAVNEKCKSRPSLEKLLDFRQEEAEAVNHEKELVEILLTMSRKLKGLITVHFGDMEEKLTKIEDMTLDQFMKVHPFEQLSSQMHGVVTYFDLDPDMRLMADVWYTNGDSHIFNILWEKHTKNFDYRLDTLVTPKEVTKGIFLPCYFEYKNIYNDLRSGHLRLKKVDSLFNDYKGKYEKLAMDLDIMCNLNESDKKHWVQERVHQIEQYHGLHLAVESVQVIMQVKEILNLKGDFKTLQILLDIMHADFNEERLDRIDVDLMQAKTVLVDITEPRRLCLQELERSKDFVTWVKEALKDINELKVFVDLASISAGENDLDVDRVACFHDAVYGYSPMLFELKPDSGFQTLNEMMKKLWRALDNDCNLTTKLHDTARHLEWLKTVKDFHGSVEMSSLSLASAINKKGIYTISRQNQEQLSLETTLKLQISEEHGEEQQIRSYTLEDLRELQSKLMLMSGSGDQHEVNHFSEIFASAQRLAVAFIDLFTAGNPLFRNWEAKINCSSLSEDAGITLDFKLGNIVSVIMVEGKIVNELPELCRKMERCLNYWNDFMDKQRSQHYYLNYYTAEQIVYLCSKLTQQNMGRFEDQVLMMLSFVKSNCTASDLMQTYNALQKEIPAKPSEQMEDVESQTFVKVSGSGERGSEMTEKTDGCTQNLQSLIKQEVGSEKMNLLWNAYMTNMKSFLPDTLDVSSFGRFLELLANKDKKKYWLVKRTKKPIQRDLPKGLAIGSPNLIACPHDQILTSCISIYMRSESEPLPTYDEVLLCNSSTPYEEVELFFRRCLTSGYRGQKLYTMLYGDQLSYEVSSKIERFFKSVNVHSRKDYRLVIICSLDQEHTYFPTAFSQYRLHMVPQEPLIKIQQYLNSHYTVPDDQESAADVFKGRQFVGVVSSERAGMGKSLYIKRLFEKLKDNSNKPSRLKCIRLIKPTADENVILQSLLNSPEKNQLTIFQFDVTSSVQKGLDECFFKLLVLGYLMDSKGRMWKCSNKQLYVIEILRSTMNQLRNVTRLKTTVNFTFLDVFPNIFCHPPNKILELEMRMQQDPSIVKPEVPLMDDQEFKSEAYQRPYQYLTRYHNHINLDRFMYDGVEGTHVKCLQLFLLYCGIKDPSWAELRNFTWFLNFQLKDCETSVFCNASITGDTLQGFKNFVVEFMILMARDFATPSLSISDQSPGKQHIDLTGEEDLAPFQIRKRWESEPHPYIFFNDDHMSMTFIGFHLQPNSENWVDAIDPSTGKVIKRNIMTKKLFDGLKLQRVPFNVDFDELSRQDKIDCICNVMGVQQNIDPDETYELTADNILKMLAILMRFRCNIPVVIMGETGCGKTRLINFLCELQKKGVNTQNMKLVKVHGGTSSEMIYTNVREAETIASDNKKKYGFDSVLFFDEANTTDALSSIKEVICDNTVKGEPLIPQCGLQIIAACNPYRKHTDEMIHRLESAGLGYRVRAEETDEKLGSIPLRQLVYRVQPLPPSMIPLVWDFGQLRDSTEKMYIDKIVKRVVQTNKINVMYAKLITNVLSASQRYMRKRKDECSFVSLRDVERCMQAFAWFYKNHEMLLAYLCKFERNLNLENHERIRDPVLWSVVMAVGVCYHACLENKEMYRQHICKYLSRRYTSLELLKEISLMQDLLLSGVPLGETIARNNALKENIFMIVICIELRIPLFLIGKPGSSKSLSKTLVADAMQGQASHSDFYKRLKQIHLVSFQCSPHSTPEGIINTFKQCARFQEGKNLKEYISVVVLDEIGLAEDSPKMPLKTLHPLLEEGCIDDESLPHKKVGFIGISNWALDPAKMNRGIFVSRGDPDEKELIESAKGICSSDRMILEKVSNLFQPFARAYLKISPEKGKGFFGLRDYYSLIKMLFAVTKASEKTPTEEEIVKAVLRNFSGRDDVDAVEVFTETLRINTNLERISAVELVRQNILAQEEECRYLLLLTKNYAALQILQQTFFSEGCQPEIIFGSSFPKDQEYTQICRNINRVKICMETGRTIVLLNLQNLYESLYDALNQYYVCLGGQKYVDLGLGTHRVKCRVHKGFRLVVIEDKDVVYNQFPIPLINRLEKHYLDIHTVLSKEQRELVADLERWVEQFVDFRQNSQTYKYKPPDVFIGFHEDTCASVVLQVTDKQREEMDIPDQQRKVLDESKLILLNCATPDSVVRLDYTGLSKVECEYLTKFYYEERKHSSLADFVCHAQQVEQSHTCFTEVTTFSRLLTESDIGPLKTVVNNVELLSLQQFDTEISFRKKIREFLTSRETSGDKVLIIQSDLDEASHKANVIASAKYSAINEINKSRKEIEGKVYVYFITKLLRLDGGTSFVGFHGGPWRSVHIDDLRRSKDIVSDISVLRNLAICQLFEERLVKAQDHTHAGTDQHDRELDNRRGWEDVLDTTLLLRSCVQSAVGMLRDQVEGGFRNTRRVEILLTLLSDNEETNGRDGFLRIVKRRLHSLLSTWGKNNIVTKNWVINEASNIDALHEGGTFRQTLWKRVQAVVIPLLAQLVSVIDRDCNLDILLDTNAGGPIKKLWLDIFGDEKLLDVPYASVDNSESKTFLVQNYIAIDKNIRCTMPFSWKIMDHLEELRIYALQHEGQTQRQFEELFWKTPLGHYVAIADKETQIELFHRYLQDFITMTMNVTNKVDLQLLCDALSCCVNELRLNHTHAMETEVISLPWVHAAYNKFKNRLQNLDRMIRIPQVGQGLLENTHTKDGMELVLDVYAAMACVEYLEPQALETDHQRLAWLRQVRRLQVPIELVCSEESLKHYGERSKAMVCRVQCRWNRVVVVSLFVEHLLLGIETVDKRLKPFVLTSMRRLCHVLERNADVKMKEAFDEVIDVLKACREGAVEIKRNSKQFRKKCSAFFIDLVSTVCFKDNSPPCTDIIQHLLSFLTVEAQSWSVNREHQQIKRQPLVDHSADHILWFTGWAWTLFVKLLFLIFHLLNLLMVETQSALNVRGPFCRPTKKAISPFGAVVDKGPVVWSVVLKLLLKYSFDEVKGPLQQHLTQVEQSDIFDESSKTELYSLYINCMEDSMCEMQCRTSVEQQECLQMESDFLHNLMCTGATSRQMATVECFQQVARVRRCLDLAVNLLVDRQRVMATEEEFLTSVQELCKHSGDDWYRVYLIRKICNQHGIECVQHFLTVADMKWLFPAEVLLKNQDGCQIDQYLVCGENYKTIRDMVGKAIVEGRIKEIDQACKASSCPQNTRTLYLLLILFREVTCLYRTANHDLRPKPELCQALVDFIKTSKVLADQDVKLFAQDLVTNQLGPLTVQAGASGAHLVVVELAIHLTAVLLCGSQGLLMPLQQLALVPTNMERAFIPTMPEDMLAAARQVFQDKEKLRWYNCPNGHPCAIGECGRPTETSRCVDCGAEIGGKGHNPVQGFTDAPNGDTTQTGHILGDPSRRDNPDMRDTKNMSSVPFNLIRLLTHMAMLLGARRHPQAIKAIIKPQVGDPGVFLMGHLLKDMEYVTRSMGKGRDDTVTAVHLVITSLLKACGRGFGKNLPTKEARNAWEMTVADNVITPQLKDLDKRLQEVSAFIRADSRVSSNPILRVLSPEPHLFLNSLPQKSKIHSSTVWNCRKRVSLLSLTHVVEQDDNKDTVPVLWTFLDKEAELRLVKFLPEILELQKNLVNLYRNVTDLFHGTIADFLQKQESVPLRAWYEKRIKIFLKTWHQLRGSLENNGEIKIPLEFSQKDLDMTSDFQVLLPRRQGHGLCSTALVSYLIARHNELVYCMDKLTGEETSFKVSPVDLTDLHVIQYDLERDVLPLILSNCQYSMKQGKETVSEYDLFKIQQQILSRFIQGKPLITLHGIPTLVNRHDRIHEIILKDMRGKIEQVPLPSQALPTLAGELQSYNDVCEALSTLEVALGFLAMTGGEPHIQLGNYLEDVLQMGGQTAPHILKAIGRYSLKHCVALWQLLTSLKSENMLRLKRDPFKGISKKYKNALTEEQRTLLAEFFNKSSAEAFLLEMHEFLILVLKSPRASDTYKPTWGVKEVLEGHLERKNLDLPPDVEESFPEYIYLSEYIEAWKFAVALKWERSQR
ncbi:E3 ubiquitin-protein ligase rnf213-alpha isoform X2 [Esox lucius]|uniref:E3 ubiquitin-protein ligase rnf213-alpha isoform X2 n=1 Tax=Esox lucius TaxID=8010 RepID=UPI001476F152|nr:E3 ubiquitin-protein ligase rnf213-alpha isoform X2 [Esox lucius]